MDDVTYADLMARADEYLTVAWRQLKHSPPADAVAIREAVLTFKEVGHALRMLATHLVGEGTAMERVRAPTDPRMRAAVRLVDALDTAFVFRPEPVDGPAKWSLAWRFKAAAISIRAATDLLATHKSLDGRWQTPESPGLEDPSARLIALGHVADLAVAVSFAQKPLSVSARLDNAVMPWMRANRLPHLGKVRNFARELRSLVPAQSVGSAIDKARVANPSIRCGDPVIELGDRIERMRITAWRASVYPSVETGVPMLIDFATAAVFLYGRAAIMAARSANVIVRDPRAPPEVRTLANRADHWRGARRRLMVLLSPSVSDPTLTEDVRAVRELLGDLTSRGAIYKGFGVGPGGVRAMESEQVMAVMRETEGKFEAIAASNAMTIRVLFSAGLLYQPAKLMGVHVKPSRHQPPVSVTRAAIRVDQRQVSEILESYGAVNSAHMLGMPEVLAPVRGRERRELFKDYAAAQGEAPARSVGSQRARTLIRHVDDVTEPGSQPAPGLALVPTTPPRFALPVDCDHFASATDRAERQQTDNEQLDGAGTPASRPMTTWWLMGRGDLNDVTYGELMEWATKRAQQSTQLLQDAVHLDAVGIRRVALALRDVVDAVAVLAGMHLPRTSSVPNSSSRAAPQLRFATRFARALTSSASGPRDYDEHLGTGGPADDLKAAAIAVGAAAELLATHISQDGEWRTPESAALDDATARLEALTTLARFSIDIADAQPMVQDLAGAAGLSLAWLRQQGFPELGAVRAAAVELTLFSEPSTDRAALQAATIAVPGIRLNDPLSELTDRIGRMRVTAWRAAAYPHRGAGIPLLIELATVGATVSGRAAVVVARAAGMGVRDPQVPEMAKNLLARVDAWRQTRAGLVILNSASLPDLELREDAAAVRGLLKELTFDLALDALPGGQGLQFTRDLHSGELASGLCEAAAVFSAIARWNIVTVDHLNTSGLLNLPGSLLTRAEKRGYAGLPDRAAESVVRTSVLAPRNRVRALLAAYEKLCAQPGLSAVDLGDLPELPPSPGLSLGL